MKKIGFGAVLIALIVIGTTLYVNAHKENGQPYLMEAGYQTNSESQEIIESRTKLDTKKPVILAVHYKWSSEIQKGKTEASKLFIKNVKSKDMVFEQKWTDDSINSGKEFRIPANSIAPGKYEAAFYRNGKLVIKKELIYF